MRLASWTPFSVLMCAALGCAVACGDDDDDSPGGAGTNAMGGEDSTGNGGNGNGGTGNKAGMPSKGGETMAVGGEGGDAPAAMDSQLCVDLGGPANIDAVVRGDGAKATTAEPFNGFKFEKDGRQASVLLNVATDPCIGQQFAHLLSPAKAADLEHLAQCLSLFVQNAAGCAVAYAGATDSEGKLCQSMTAAHVGLGITEEDYMALVTDAATALIAAGVDPGSPQFMAVAGALTSDELKAAIITGEPGEFSQPGAMCESTGGAGAGGAAMGGAGGAP
jgi:hypothetical protein